jgi:hypothetical protein
MNKGLPSGDLALKSHDDPRVILCTPRNPLSATFDLEGDGSDAVLRFGWVTETGNIEANGRSFTVEKQGALSGHWTLVEDGNALVEAVKTSPLKRTFEVEGPMGFLDLRATALLKREFSILRSGVLVATIIPEGLLTRRSSIVLYVDDYHWPTISFLFWIVVMCWRRDESA